jgi:hypothetical protein
VAGPPAVSGSAACLQTGTTGPYMRMPTHAPRRGVTPFTQGLFCGLLSAIAPAPDPTQQGSSPPFHPYRGEEVLPGGAVEVHPVCGVVEEEGEEAVGAAVVRHVAGAARRHVRHRVCHLPRPASTPRSRRVTVTKVTADSVPHQSRGFRQGTCQLVRTWETLTWRAAAASWTRCSSRTGASSGLFQKLARISACMSKNVSTTSGR